MVRRIVRTTFGVLALASAITWVPSAEAATQDGPRTLSALKQLMALCGEVKGVFRAASAAAQATSAKTTTTTTTPPAATPVPASNGPGSSGMMLDPNGVR